MHTTIKNILAKQIVIYTRVSHNIKINDLGHDQTSIKAALTDHEELCLHNIRHDNRRLQEENN